MSERIAIRLGDAARDRAFIVDLGRRVASTSVSSQRVTVLPLVEAAYEQLIDYTLRRDHEILVAEVDDVAAAFALLLYDEPDQVSLTEQTFVAYMAVEPAWERRGIGRTLLAIVEEQARKRGFPYLTLMVTEENAAARALYESAGFTTERRQMVKEL